MIINKTESFCCECQTLHPAVIRSENGKIFFDVLCKKEKKILQISSNAEIFLTIREKSYSILSNVNLKDKYSWLNILEITNHCNFICPVCYADAGDKHSDYMTIPEIIDSAKNLKQQKRKAITLSGGEPTLHPDLFEIIKKLRDMDLDVTMITNALLLGEDETIAKKIKKSGLTYCYMQFDTFDQKTHQKLRGNDFIEIKKNALKNAKQAGIYFGIITTVIKDNINETGKIISYAAEFLPNLAIVTFLAAVPAGRFEIKQTDLIDREAIIESLINAKTIQGLTPDNFWPYPKFSPLGIHLHPDCAVLLFLAVNNKKIEPLENYLNIQKLYKLMERPGGPVNRFWGFFLFTVFFTVSIKIKKVIPLYIMLIGLMLKRGKHSIMMVSIEQFMNEQYQDQQRINCCTTSHILKNGVMVPACIYNHPDSRRDKFTRKNIQKKT